MFPGWLQEFFRLIILNKRSKGTQWSPAIRWSSAIRWSPAIRWSIGSMDFDDPKVYGDTSITDAISDGLVGWGVIENAAQTCANIWNLPTRINNRGRPRSSPRIVLKMKSNFPIINKSSFDYSSLLCGLIEWQMGGLTLIAVILSSRDGVDVHCPILFW